MSLFIQQALLLTLFTYMAVAIEYNGTEGSWAKYSKWNMCPDNEASLDLTFVAQAKDGILAYMEDSNSNDFLVVSLKDGKLAMDYLFGNGEPTKFVRTDKVISFGQEVSITITRLRMALTFRLSFDKSAIHQIANYGSDLCFGECLDLPKYRLSPSVSNLYIGGVPQSIRSKWSDERAAIPQFSGQIYDVSYKNCECFNSNPLVMELGDSLKQSASRDPCFNKTASTQGCVCKVEKNSNTCGCSYDCFTDEKCSDHDEYKLTYNQQEGSFLVNEDGLDAKVEGTPRILQFPFQYLLVGEDRTYAQMAGESQRDECLGNLDYCPDGYTLSFWFAVLNDQLNINNGLIIDNGGYDSHGVAIYWENNKLVTKFKKPDGQTWITEADALWPAQVHLNGEFVNYWYHYAATWSPSRGLTVYLNGEPVDRPVTITTNTGRANDIRKKFLLGPGSSNKIGFGEIKFTAKHQSQDEIFGRVGPKHYYFSMNRIEGNKVVAWPYSLDARLKGSVAGQLVKGMGDMALKLGSISADGLYGDSYIDAGNVSHTCFGYVSSCDFYMSFWLRLDELRNGMVILDTGRRGVTVLYKDQQLQAYIYTSDNGKPAVLQFGPISAGQWYFVEVNRVGSKNQLWINNQMVHSAVPFPGRVTSDLAHNGDSTNLLIGSKNDRNYRTIGTFTIDQLEMFQGNREDLLKIGHIQRGIPPHAFYMMNSLNGQYVDFINESIQHVPTGEVRGNPELVPGKDMNALRFSPGSNFQITNPRRNEECYSNIEKCVHGLLVRGWFNIEQLRETAGIMSTGINGIDMAFENGRLLVTADTGFRKWQATSPVSEREWQFLEVSFHPKYGLSVYNDLKKESETVSSSDKTMTPNRYESRFIVGGMNDGNHINVPITVDDLEIWYGTRDYVESLCLITPCQRNHYIIDFDEADQLAYGNLKHELLRIPYTGTLERGWIANAMDVRNRQYAEVTKIKHIDANVYDRCLGNLTLCKNGFTVDFYLYPKSLPQSGTVYYLSTGIDGVDVYYKDGKLYAEARALGKQWQVESPSNYLQANTWNNIIIAWSPTKGLVLARDDRNYLVDQDGYGEPMSNKGSTGMVSRFLIGYTDKGTVAPQASFDEMRLFEWYIPPNLGPIEHDSFSFERNHIISTRVEHPKFEVTLVNGVQIVEGAVGNTSSLNGNGQFIDLGSHIDTCLDNLEKCDSGLTLTFSLKPRSSGYRDGQVVLSGNSYDITIENRKLVAKFMTADKMWDVTSFPLDFDKWNLIDLSWTADQGLSLYVNDILQQEKRQSSNQQRTNTQTRILVGKSENLGYRQFYTGEVDEIHFWKADRQELVKKGIIAQPRCNFISLKVGMDEIIGGKIPHPERDITVHNNPSIVPGLHKNAIELRNYQHIDVGSRVSCQSRPSACANGFTMRFAIRPDVLTRNSYIISSNPAEVAFGNDGNLHVRYRSESGVWDSTLSGLEKGQWYTIDLSWDDENGMTVYVNNVQRSWLQKTNSPIDSYDQSNHFFINKPSSPSVSAYEQSDFAVDDLQIWDAKLELLKACGLLPPAPKDIRHVAIYPPEGTGYIRFLYVPTSYDVINSQNETLTIRFSTSNKDGLLWYNVDGDIKSYIYLKDGQLWFVTKKGEGPPMVRTISTVNLADGKDHTLLMKSINGNQLTFIVDGQQVRAFNAGHPVRFLREDFNVGGHRYTSRVTDGTVDRSFVGQIKDVKVTGDSFPDTFDIFEALWNKTFPVYIRTHCNLHFDPVIDPLCDQGISPITFLENNTYIYIDEWANIGKKPSLEVRFTTVEPRGLLLFTGERNNRFFALEVFDRNLYMVADFGNGVVTKQISPGEAADNIPHTAKFVFNTDENKINIFFDGERRPQQEVSLGGIQPGKSLFSGQVYLGGYPNYDLLPWHILSRSGFIGCVEELQINTLSSQLQDIYKKQGAINIVDGCLSFNDHCNPNPCSFGAPCYNRKDKFFCDCTRMLTADYQNDICQQLTLVGNIEGDRYYDLDMGEILRTHVFDISTMFKTPAEKGTLWMTNNPLNSDYAKVFMDNGELKVSTSINGKVTTASIPGRYNDYEWHTINVRRRANTLYIWVDNNEAKTVDLNDKDFYMNIKTIRLGADTPNAGNPPYFFGHMRNFRVTGDGGNPITFDRKPPFTDADERVIVINPVTLLTPEAYLKIGNTQDELKADFMINLNIKTKQENSLLLYQPGTDINQYLSAFIENSKLYVRFNFGGRDETILMPNYLSDDNWHNIVIYRKSIDSLIVKVDNGQPSEQKLDRTTVLTNLQFDHSDNLFLGGIPDNILLPASLRNYYSNGYRGCMSTFVKSQKVLDLGADRLQAPEVLYSKSVVRGCVPQPECRDEQCLNGCTCADDKSACDNSMHPFHGPICELPDVGFKFFVGGYPGQVTFEYIPPTNTQSDKISFGFITCYPSGLLAKISGSNSREEIKIYLQGGRVVAEYQLGGSQRGKIVSNKRYDDSKVYTVQFERTQNTAELRIISPDGSLERQATVITGDTYLNGLRLLEIGSEKQNGIYSNEFKGIIFGFKHDRYAVFNLAKAFHSQTTYKQPGTSVISGDIQEAFKCEVPEDADCGPGKPECMNYGVCMNNKCNCSLTAWTGTYCTDEPEGHYYGFNNFKPGLVVHEYPQGVTTYEDYFAVGFMTYEPTGTIFRVQSTDNSQYYHVRLVDGKAQLEYNLNGEPRIVTEDRITLNSNDSIYQVIRMNRTGSNITFFVNDLQLTHVDDNIANIPFRNQKILMSGGLLAPPNQVRDDWNGIVAGLYYNNKMLYHLPFNQNGLTKYGDIESAPHPFKLKFPPPPACSVCYNGGIKLDSGICDCSYTTFSGVCCDSREGIFGFQHKKYGNNSVVIYTNSSMGGSRIDDLSLGFRTARGWENGEIVRIQSKNGKQFVIIEVVDDLFQVRHNIGGVERREIFNTIDARDKNQDHIFRLHREGSFGTIKLDGVQRSIDFPNADIFNAYVIYTGGNVDEARTAVDGHYGMIWGLNYNGIDIVSKTRQPNAGESGISIIDEKGYNFEVHEWPWPALCDKGSSNPECNTPPPPPPPTAPGGAGGIIPSLGGGGIINPIPVITPPLVGGAPVGAIIGAIMGGLLFSSAIAWAASGMKPGFLALSRRLAGMGGKGAYVPVSVTDGKAAGAFPVSGGNNYLGTVGMDEYGGGSQVGSRKSQYDESYMTETKFDEGMGNGAAVVGNGMNGGAGYNTYNTTSSWYTRNETIESQQQQHGYNGGAGSTMGYGNGRAGGYAGSVAGGSVSGSVYGFGTVTNPDQAFITLSEDIAVDNVVLTADGRYVVTGSNLGPPQVWNTNNGEMVTTMRGDFMGSTGLHLAANEQYLVGETMAEQAAVDMNDIQTGNHIPIRRLAVWDFNTGNPLPIAVDQLCTASCVSKDGYKVIMAMTDKFGGGTTVKVLDLLSNQILNELTYPDTIGVADSASCVFISPDDRFVAVGFTNSFDNNANFIIFDLHNKSGIVDSPIVALNADPHCTVILNHDEALTGTRNGELVIWSMKTGKAQRQLTSGDATTLSHGGMPAAHDREVKEVALSDDGKYLASASADRTVKVWSMDTESLMHTLHGHNDEVWTVDIASDNSIIVSGSQDGTIRLWRLRNGNQVTSFNATMDIFHARFSKDKKTVVALGDKFGARKLIMLQIISQKKWRVRHS